MLMPTQTVWRGPSHGPRANKRTIHTQLPELASGSVLQLPSGKFAVVLRKVSNDLSWKLAQVDVAKARMVENSEMELSAAYLAQAKLAYSSHVWQERCIAARLEEAKHAKQGGVHG